jgi:hypothetical protein
MGGASGGLVFPESRAALHFAHRISAAAFAIFLRDSVPLFARPPLAPFLDMYSLILGSMAQKNTKGVHVKAMTVLPLHRVN